MKKSTRVAKAKKINEKIQKTKTAKPKKDDAAEFSVAIYNSKGKEVEKVTLNKKLFSGAVNKKVLYQAVVMYNANQRQGNASTKTRGEVSGGGKKPWRQKGTGRARAGSSRSPLWRHGGTIFGPKPRDFHYELPRKVKKLAFLSSINSKLNEGRVLGIDAIELAAAKTKNFKAILNALKLKGNSLLVLDTVDDNVMRASRNLEEVSVRNYKDFNTMDVLKCDNLLILRSAIEKLPERFRS